MISNSEISQVTTAATFSGWLNQTNMSAAALTSVVLTADTGNVSDPFSGANSIPTTGTVTHHGTMVIDTVVANSISSVTGNLNFSTTTLNLDSASAIVNAGTTTLNGLTTANSLNVTGNAVLASLSSNSATLAGVSFAPGTTEFGNSTVNVNAVFYGNAQVLGNVSGFQNLSDPRLKENYRAIKQSEIDFIYNLPVYEFDWKKSAPVDGIGHGVRADEVEVGLPDFVHVDALGFKEVEYQRFVPYLLQMVKDLNAEVETLRGRLDRE